MAIDSFGALMSGIPTRSKLCGYVAVFPNDFK